MDVVRPHPRMRSRAVALAAIAGLAFTGAAAVAAGPAPVAPPCTAAVPDVWAVSTRGLPGHCRLPERLNPGVERLRPDGACWERAERAGLFDDPRRPVMVFIHGNRYEHASARQQGLELARRSAACGGAAVRTIVYSWPSEQQGILLKDGRAKYERAFVEGHSLAWLLGQLDPEQPVAIVGYSFGAIIALEAFQDLAVAEHRGAGVVHSWRDRPAPVNVVLIAPAIRCDALAPRGPYGDVVEHIDRLTLLTNSTDDALRFFPLLDRSRRAEALGYVGMPRFWMPAGVPFSSVDAANIVGRTHGFPHYLSSPTLMHRICSGAMAGLAPTP
ncbi:MAG: alpha/beta hydrolase [Planctomycetia bacterium]|nr:alpha/beta hydrolase [Planctomycetia bacterium]